MDEMPQAESRRARQEHGALVARGLAEGLAKIVEEATFTDALGIEFGLALAISCKGLNVERKSPLQMGMAKVQKTPRKASSWSLLNMPIRYAKART